MRSVLKRGLTCGILKKIGNRYSLPIDNKIAQQEIATQEIGLLDLYCQRKVQRSTCRRRRVRRGNCKCGRRRARRRSRGCGTRSCANRRQRRRRRCTCRGFGKGARNRKIKSRTEYNLGDDKLTRSDQSATEATAAIGIEPSYSNMLHVE